MTNMQRLSQLKLDDASYWKVTHSFGISLKQVCSMAYYKMIRHNTVLLAQVVIQNERITKNHMYIPLIRSVYQY